jgi:DnaJ-class molecular chaperone
MDYYKILELKRDCTDADIKKAYRRKAISWHPERNEGKSKDVVQQKFKSISEAYFVLSDSMLRAVFDQYGEKGLKNGVPNGSGGMIPAWSFTQNPETLFAEFFGSFSPFADFFNGESGINNLFADTGAKQGPKCDAQVLSLYCSLEELYAGCSKKVKIVRQRLKPDGSGRFAEERVMSVDINPGWREGTKITFTNEGDEEFKRETGDVVFVLKERTHSCFSRIKDDLKFTAKINLVQALTGTSIEVQTLDGRKLPIAISEIVRPGLIKTLVGEGMPLPRDPSKKGNLVIAFDVTYPDMLTETQKTAMREILPM